MRSPWIHGVVGAAFAIGVVTLLGTATTFSRPGRGCHGHAPGARLDRLEEKLAALDLDAETRAAAASVLERARSEGESRRDSLHDARRTLRELVEQEPPVVEQVMAQADELGALETDAHKAKLRTMLELRALLGPERWQSLRESLKPRHHGPMERS